MYTKEQISRKYNCTSEPAEKLFLLSHLLTEIILREKIEDSNEAEYLEGLILSSFIVFNKLPLKDEPSMTKIRASLCIALSKYYFEIPNLHTINCHPVPFFNSRLITIENELSRMNKDQNYLTPYLVYNLYIKPMNQENSSLSSIVGKIEYTNLFKLCIGLKIKLKYFHETYARHMASFNLRQ